MKTYKALLLIALIVACHTCELFAQNSQVKTPTIVGDDGTRGFYGTTDSITRKTMDALLKSVPIANSNGWDAWFGQTYLKSQTCELKFDSAQSAQFQAGNTTPGVLNLKGVSAVTTPGTAANLKMINDAGSGRIEFKTGGAPKYEGFRSVNAVTPGKISGAYCSHYFDTDSTIFYTEFPSRVSQNITMVITPRYQKLSDSQKAMQLQVMEMFILSEKKKLKGK